MEALSASSGVLVEACVETVRSARAAEAGGAGRLELCADLVRGGTTPSIGLIAQVLAAVKIPVNVLVRPRAGDFLYDADDRAVIRRDVVAALAAGADGVVIGALTADGDVDERFTRDLVDLARANDGSVTYHRAFDVVRDRARALDTLMSLHVDRVLTSGGAASALEGVDGIGALVRHADGRIAILAGGGINAANAAEIVRRSGVREIHLRGAAPVESGMSYRRPEIAFGTAYAPDEYAWSETQARLVADAVAAVRDR